MLSDTVASEAKVIQRLEQLIAEPDVPHAIQLILKQKLDEVRCRLMQALEQKALELVKAYKFTNADNSTVIYVECPQKPDYYLRVFSDHYHQTVNVEWMNAIPKEVKNGFRNV